MKSPYRILIVGVLSAALCAAAAYTESSRPDKVFPVNDNNTGQFDQPSVAMNGLTANVAFIGDTTGTGFKVYYAAINSGADFRTVHRDNTLILTAPTTVDNTDVGNDTYADARHPKIAVRSGNEVVILFQAKPVSTADTAYRLYIARLTLAGNTVVQKSVKLVQGIPAGTVEDVSWTIVTADSTARAAYATRSAIDAPEPFQVVFARIGLDNATAAAPVAITASFPASQGFRPLPNLKFDDFGREHIAWTAASAPGSPSGWIYYALIKETNGVDNMVLAPSVIMKETPYTFPSVLIINHSLIAVVASADAGDTLAYVELNPDAVTQNGQPVSDNNIIFGQVFLQVPPGEPLLAGNNFHMFRPDAFYEPGSGRIFMTGYGKAGSGARFLGFTLNPGAFSADIVQGPVTFALDETPSGIDNDYTQAAFGFPGGKIIVFWSGAVGAAGNRNLDVTTIPTLAAWVNSSQSGCGMVADPAHGAAGRVPAALALFLPAVVLAARRIVVGRGKRRARRADPGSRGPAGGTIGR